MYKNYLKIILRNFKKQKVYVFINVFGLAIGLAGCLLIGLWILDEINYDRHYPDTDQIFVILVNDEPISPNALGLFLQNGIPEIKYAGRILGDREITVIGTQAQAFEKYMVIDPEIIDIFSFSFIDGDPKTALTSPNSVVITEKMAAKYFPEGNAVGKNLLFNNRQTVTIAGVIRNVPHNSTIQFDFLVPLAFEKMQNSEFSQFPDFYESWEAWSAYTGVKVRPGVTATALTQKISDLIQNHYDNETPARLSAIKISDLHFRFSNARTTVLIFSGIALIILIMACMNFINLSTARYKLRNRETGIRKVLGAGRGSLIMQFLVESFILTITGFLIALIIIELALPAFNTLFQLHLSPRLLLNGPTIMALLGGIILTALVSGLYPALVLSRFRPIKALKETVSLAVSKINLRKILVVVQFSLTLILIIATAIIYAQIKYIKNWPVGYTKDHVINIPLRDDSQDFFDILKSELLRNPEIFSVTGSMHNLPYWNCFTAATWTGIQSDKGERVSMNYCGYDFTRTYGIELKEGRDFSREFESDTKSTCIINAELADLINTRPILGTKINIWGEERTIIGVMENFNFQTLDQTLAPLAMMMINEDNSLAKKASVLTARIGGDKIEESLEYIKNTWNRILPNRPFEYSFLDEEFDAAYKSAGNIQNLAACFGGLAIFIACLGLFGLASFTAEQRTKEIGIRKVFGASIANIIYLISQEFVTLIVISNLIAWPLAWLAMNRWLGEYAHHGAINISTFIMAGLFVLSIALISVGYQAIRAACANPIDSIKYE